MLSPAELSGALQDGVKNVADTDDDVSLRCCSLFCLWAARCCYRGNWRQPGRTAPLTVILLLLGITASAEPPPGPQLSFFVFAG